MIASHKATILLLCAILVLGTFGLASGQNVYVDINEVGGLDGDGLIPEAGTDLTIPVRFTNAVEARSCISNGYAFTSDNVTFSTISGAWNEGYPWDLAMAMALMQFPMYYDVGLFINYFDSNLDGDMNGAGFAGLRNSGSGLPIDFDDSAYTITLTGVTGPAGGVLTMDSSFWVPANVWLWCGDPTLYPPWGGPYEFTVAGGGGEAPVITSTAVTSATYGTPYTYDVDATGDPVPTYALTTFPAGMTIDAVTGVIGWDPTDVGDFAVVVEASNSEGTDAQSFNITVGGIAPTFTSTPITTGTYGVAYSYDANTDGYPAATFALTTFPAGMTIDAVTGVVSWTPGDVGPFDVVIEATNVAGAVTQAYTINVDGVAPTFTSSPILTGTYGVAYSYDADADGYPAATFALTTFPAGMTIDAVTGIVSWTPGDVGDFDVVVEATNMAGTATQAYTISVDGIAPTFTSSPVLTGTYGVAYSYDADADGYPAATFALTTFPAGMTIDAVTGVVSWTPGDVGDFDVVVEATNMAGTATQAYTISVDGIAPTFTSSPVLTGTYGVAYSYDADADGYPAATFALTTFPAGMTIDAVTGIVSWTPGDVGPFDVVIEATNMAGTATQAYTIDVDGIAPTFTSSPVLTGTYGVAYSYDADADGYPAATFALTTFPTGMTINAVTGIVSWTPGDVGDFDVVVEATNMAGTATQAYTISVDGIAPTFTSSPILTGTYGVAYSYDADADGYPAATFALTTFPTGMTINAVTGIVSWTPGDVGNFDVVVEASNMAGTVTQAFTIAVDGVAPSFTSTPILTGTYGVAYSYDADADGYPAATFALTTFPAGMTINAVTGIVSWTPGDVGDFDVVVEATNMAGTATQAYTISVDGIAPTFTSSPILTGTYGVAYSYDADADGYPAATFALTTFPTGMTINAVTGIVSWTPGDVGNFDVVVEASNMAGTVTQAFTIAVDGVAPSFTSTPILTGTYGVAYSYDADADGYPAATFALTTAPGGMTIDAVTGIVSWTPGDVGDFDVVIEATNMAGTATQAYTISVDGIAPTFTSSPVLTGTYGVAYSYDADADGYPAATFALTTFPAGMTIDAVTGIVSWTPGDVGDFDVVIEATNMAGTATQAYTISVDGIAPTFTSSPILTGTYDVAYSYDADADGYPAATFALLTAPAGMTVDAVTGMVNWTPADVGDFDVVIEAANSAGAVTQAFTITVDGIAPSFTSSPVTIGRVGDLYVYNADADGYPAATFTLTTFPVGMTIDAVTGLVEWTPGAVGDYDVVVEASNSAGTDVQSYTISVIEGDIAPSITTSPVTDGVVGSLYSYDVDATGNPTPSFALTVFPAGMTIDAVSGLIQWTPGTAGDFDVTVTAANGIAPDAVQSFVITVTPAPEAPVITSTPGTSGVVGSLYSYDVEATGYPAPGYALTVFPAGMTINATTGLIQWTPTTDGDFDVTVVAANGVAPDAVQSFTITVTLAPEAPVITSTPITDGVVGVAYAYDVDATGYPAPTFALTTFPTGMTIDAVTGMIAWTPDAVGDFDVVVEAANSEGTATQSFTIAVVAAPANPVITSTPITSGVVGVAYVYDVDATGNPAPTYALCGAPAGMTIDPVTGVISWTPTGAGDFDVCVMASNGVGPDAVQNFTISVMPAPEAPVITSTPITDGVVGVAYAYDVDATGYPAPTFALTTFPTGMTIDAVTGMIAWTPDAVGDFDVTVVAANGVAPDAVQSFTIAVVAAPATPVITSTPITDGVVGTAYVYDVDATGNPAPTFALTTAPAGMTIDAITGVINFLPTAAGDYSVCVEADNGVGTDVQCYTITVTSALVAPVITSTPITDGVVGVAYAYDVDATGNPAPTFALATFPTGMTIDAVTGMIAWTPDTAGDFAVVVEATNSEGTDTQSFTITVVAAPVAPVITSTPITDGVLGTAYAYDVDATGNPAPGYALTVFPTGMTIDAVSGMISWMPGDSGDYDVTVVASNGVVPDAVQSFTITVTPITEAPVIISTPVTDAWVGLDYVYNVDASGYPAPTYTLTLAPTGMTIDEVSGLIEWLPTAAGTFDVTVVATNSAGEDTQEFTIIVPADPWTDCWPQPTILKSDENDRLLDIRIYNENPDDVVFSSMRVQGKIPAYTEVRVVDGVIVTDVFIMRFLGSSGFRPIPPEGIQSTYTVEYDKTDGSHPILEGDYLLNVVQGDVDLDGQVDIADIQFMAEYFWNGGEESHLYGESLYEFMDVDANGTVDITDIMKIIEISGM